MIVCTQDSKGSIDNQEMEQKFCPGVSSSFPVCPSRKHCLMEAGRITQAAFELSHPQPGALILIYSLSCSSRPFNSHTARLGSLALKYPVLGHLLVVKQPEFCVVSS